MIAVEPDIAGQMADTITAGGLIPVALAAGLEMRKGAIEGSTRVMLALTRLVQLEQLAYI